jgi:PTH2 family peptidyl-tRNA hydrolase
VSDTKQVLVVRRDLNMRRGKECAQSGHAAMSFITRRLVRKSANTFEVTLTDPEIAWLESSYKKITLQVQGEPELLELAERAKNAGLQVHVVTDAGLTEFGGVPTVTCCAIGPDDSKKIDAVTGHLRLY